MKFDVEGYNIDNLLKQLHFKKVSLYNLKRNDYNKVSFEVDEKNEKKVKRLVANFKVKTGLKRCKVLPNFLLKHLGVIIGLFIGVISAIFFSNYIWQIKIYGVKDLNETEIMAVLSENGVKVGKINTKTNEDIEDILLNKYDRIAQVSVIKIGTAIVINLSEKLVYEEQVYEPIKAEFSGIIKSINCISGTLNCRVGDYVNKGDYLVLPFNLDKSGNKISIKPVAEIKAQMFVVSKCELNKNEIVLKRTGGEITTYEYSIFNKDLFSGKNKNSFALFEFVVYNENISKLIPFSRRRIVYYELGEFEVRHNFNEEKDALVEQSKVFAYESAPKGEIIDEKTSLEIGENKMFACTILTVLGNINVSN